MSLSSPPEDRPNEIPATTFKLDTVESMRPLLQQLLDFSQTTSQTDFLNTVEMYADAFRWYIGRHKNEIETAINHYKTIHDLNHQAQVKKYAIQKLGPLMPIQEYSEMEMRITATAQKAAMGMRDLREIVRMLRDMAKFQEWVVWQY